MWCGSALISCDSHVMISSPSHTAQHPHDLPFSRGDRLTILEPCNVIFWYLAEDAHGKRGVIPINFVKVCNGLDTRWNCLSRQYRQLWRVYSVCQLRGRKAKKAQQTTHLHLFFQGKRKSCPGWDSNPRHSEICNTTNDLSQHQSYLGHKKVEGGKEEL